MGMSVSGDAVQASVADANLANQLNQLVQAMASFAPPTSANLNLPADAQEQYNAMLTASGFTQKAA